MSDHDVVVQLYYAGDWQDAPALTRAGITLSRGAPSEGQDAPPSAAGLTLDNRTGAYNPRNPTGPLYGLVGRNTPLRVSADGSVRSTTEVASWAPGREIKGSAWTTVQGGGILRRLQQGKTPLKSPPVRAAAAAGAIAFWPLEDGPNATVAASGLTGGDPLALSGTTGFGQGDGYPDGPKILALGKGGGILRAPLRGATAEFGVEFTARMPSSESSAPNVAEFMDIVLQGGTIPLMTFFTNVDMNVTLFGVDEFGVGPAAGTGSNIYDGGYRHYRVNFDQSGADVVVTWYVDGTLVTTETYTTETLGIPVDVVLNPNGTASNLVDMATIGYLAFYNSAAPAWADGIPHLGYPGELAGARFARVCDEEGLPYVILGDPDDTQPMGPQPAGTLLTVLRDCVTTDDGILYEPRDDRAVAMRTGRSRYNQDAGLTLDFTGGQLAAGLAPVLDDRPTRNDVTATRRGGSSVRAIKTSGPMNVSDPIDDPEGVGRVDVQVDVNPATDEMLTGQAYWHLHKGTVDEARYPGITVDLDAAPELAAAVDALELGDRVDLENLPEDWQAGNAALLLLGVRENYPPGAGDYRRLVTLNTAPASAYEIGLVGENDGSTDLRGQAVDTDNSTLGAGIGNYDTTLSVASTGGVLWTTDADDWDAGLNGGGLFILVGGEEMRVTNISGASSPQTFTVVRSTNGVVKAHASGAAVHVAHPSRVGL